MRTAVYPGSFDPVTHGHRDIVERAARLFDRVIVAVGDNPRKKQLLPVDVRVDLLREELAHLENVEVDQFSGLLVDYAKSRDCAIIIRALRAMSDFDAEFQMSVFNTELFPGIETLLLMTDKQYFYLSSSMLKELSSQGGDISRWVCPKVAEALAAKLKDEV
ncbi:MAG: pantetheine-phosphate adenylyltransferase [archaeon]